MSSVLLLLFLLWYPTVVACEIKGKEFWIWPKAKIVEFNRVENTLYILRGLITKTYGKDSFLRQGEEYKNIAAKIVLVYRVQYLPEISFLNQLIDHDIRIWRNRNSQVIGVQLDYDSPTSKLSSYSDFLKKVRLPNNTNLSITGLADWVRHGHPKELLRLQETVQFIAFQMYSHAKPYEDLDSRLQDLKRLKIPFKLGILDATPLPEISNCVSSITFKG